MINVSVPVTDGVAPRPFMLSPIRRFQAGLVVGDAALIAVAVLISHVARFGFTDAVLGVSSDRINAGYLGVSVIMGCLWLLLLRGLHRVCPLTWCNGKCPWWPGAAIADDPTNHYETRYPR